MRQHVDILKILSPSNFFRAARIALAGGWIIIWLLAAASATLAGNTAESRGVVDPAAGMFSSMKFDVYGNAHVSYFDPSDSQLRYGFWDHTLNRWFTTTVDKSGGFCSLALDSHQHPHISYLDYGTGKLMYAHWDGVSWQKQAIPIPARLIEFYTSIALDPTDYPSISFYYIDTPDGTRVARLKTVTWNGKFWALTTVDSTLGTGKFNSIAVDSQGHPHIAYATVNYENASLRYAYWNGQSWETEILEGAGVPGSSCWSVSLVLDKEGNPHITYTDVPHLLVKYASKKDGRWKIEVVDSIGKQGYPDRNGITLDDQENPYLSYYDAGAGLLKVAHRGGQKWISEVVDRGAGFQSSLQIDHGAIWVAYGGDESGGPLKYFREPLEQINQVSQEKPVSLLK